MSEAEIAPSNEAGELAGRAATASASSRRGRSASILLALGQLHRNVRGGAHHARCVVGLTLAPEGLQNQQKFFGQHLLCLIKNASSEVSERPAFKFNQLKESVSRATRTALQQLKHERTSKKRTERDRRDRAPSKSCLLYANAIASRLEPRSTSPAAASARKPLETRS